MKVNEAPEKVYLHLTTGNRLLNGKYCERKPAKIRVDDKIIEYTRTDAFIEKVMNFLSHKLDDVVAIRVGGAIIPRNVAKQEVIEDFRKYMKGETWS